MQPRGSAGRCAPPRPASRSGTSEVFSPHATLYMEQTVPFRYTSWNRTLRSATSCGPRRKELAVTDANHSAQADDGIRLVPEGYRAVTPWIISRDTAGLLDLVKEAFGARREGGLAGHAGLLPAVRRGRRCRLPAGA